MSLIDLAKDCWLFVALLLSIVTFVIRHDMRKERNESSTS